MDRHTHGCTDGRTYDRHNTMTIAHWPLASVAKTCNFALSPLFPRHSLKLRNPERRICALFPGVQIRSFIKFGSAVVEKWLRTDDRTSAQRGDYMLPQI